jgi:hypothetical protein
VPRGQKILPIGVRDHDRLMPVVEGRVNSRVHVLVEPIKPRHVELRLVIVVVTEEANSGLVIVVEKASKIRVELLNTSTHRNEVVPLREVGEVNIGEEFLEPHVVGGAGIAPRWVREEDSILLCFDLVKIKYRCDTQLKIGGLKRGIPLNETERHDHIFAEDRLIPITEGIVAIRAPR